jgi:hypothetical protein
LLPAERFVSLPARPQILHEGHAVPVIPLDTLLNAVLDKRLGKLISGGLELIENESSFD